MAKAKTDKKPKATKGPKLVKEKKAKGSGLVPRKSQFAGKKIKILAAENPRRVGTLGHKSFSLLKNGMTYEEFVQAGGRRIDLAWDVAHGHVGVS